MPSFTCVRCGLTDTSVLDLDTGSACHAELKDCLAALRGEMETLRTTVLVERTAIEQLREQLAAVTRQRDEYHRLWKAEVLKRREGEAQQAAGEPVAWALWDAVGENVMNFTQDRDRAERWRSGFGDPSRVTSLYTHPAPSAAAVTVTDAMVEAAWKELRVQCAPDGPSLVDCVDRDDLRSAITAALTTASEGASA